MGGSTVQYSYEYWKFLPARADHYRYEYGTVLYLPSTSGVSSGIRIARGIPMFTRCDSGHDEAVAGALPYNEGLVGLIRRAGQHGRRQQQPQTRGRCA